jgi:hypothetical protein
MKRGTKISVIGLILIMLLSSFISADIIFTQQTKPVYNLGDAIYVPVTVKTLTDVPGGIFQMDLICNGTLINFYKNGVKLLAGDEKDMDSSLVLINSVIQGNSGMCKIKASLNDEYQLSEEFKISKWLSVSGGIEGTEFNAGENFWITGEIKRESGENSNGFVDVSLINKDLTENISQFGTVNNGVLKMNFSLPSNLRAGGYLVQLNAYEKDSEGIITNNGFAEYNLSIRQVPTNLELVVENENVEPGAIMRVKAILHDQTGDSINTTAYITIKDSTDKIIEQKEVNTNIFFEYPISSFEPPSEWKIHATSKKLIAEENFKINEKESVQIGIVNKTVSVTNIGNVFYNKTLLVKIGESPLNIQVALDVGESKKYILSAPNGEYQVRVATDKGEEVSETLSLTGNVIGIREDTLQLTTLAWVLFILVLAVGLFFLIKKLRKRKFLGRMPSFKFKKKESKELPVMKEDSISRTINKAELSMTIKGNKQEASVVCLKLKNLAELRDRKGSASDAISKIKRIAEENKAVVYDNQNYLFFFLTPVKTKTMKNEKLALDLAEQIQKAVSEHNRMFNQKIEFGISLNIGEVVGKVEDDTFQFMGMGTLMGVSKRLATLSNEEILLSEKINDLLRVNARAEKEMREETTVYVLKSIKRDNEEARKFISKFLNRQEKE